MRSLMVFAAAVFALVVALPAVPGRAAPDRERTKGKAPVVAVLPFKVLNKEASLQHYGEGASDAVINKIVNDGALRVVEESQLDKAVNALSRNQTGLFEEDSALQIGQMVDARYIVIGSVQIIGDDKTGQIKLNARVLEVESRQLLVSESVFGPLSNAFQQYDEIAARLVGKMTYHLAQRVNAGETADEVAVAQLIADGKAYDPAFPATNGIAKDLNRAVASYNKAVLRDPKNARANLALAHAEFRQSEDARSRDLVVSERLLTAARDHVRRSTELDGNSAFAWALLGRCEGRLQNHTGARLAFEKALAIDGGMTDARFGLAVALYNAGQFEAARDQAGQARAAGDTRADGLLQSINAAIARMAPATTAAPR